MLDFKEVTETVRQLNLLADKGNQSLVKLEAMGVRFDPQKPLDLRIALNELPGLISATKELLGVIKA